MATIYLLHITLVASAALVIQSEAQEVGTQNNRGQNQRAGPECRLNVDVGTCNQNQTRFYYDGTNEECKTFQYGGCRGNLNNFDSLKTCNQRCKCSQRLDIGTGSENLKRFFYNTEKRRCERFTYRGSYGNSNKFSTRADCKQTCTEPDSRSKCAIRPSFGNGCSRVASSKQYYYDNICNCCRSFRYSGCGGNSNRFETMTDCMLSCFLPVSVTTTTSSTQTTMSTPTSSPTTVPQTTTLLTITTAAPSTTSSTTTIPTTTTPTPTTALPTTAATQTTATSTTSSTSSTSSTLTTSTTTTPPTTTLVSTSTIPFTTQRSYPELCFQQPTRGICSQDLIRLYYDATSNTCKTFLYSGCGGNGNNFMLLSDCEHLCKVYQVTTTPKATSTTPILTTTASTTPSTTTAFPTSTIPTITNPKTISTITTPTTTQTTTTQTITTTTATKPTSTSPATTTPAITTPTTNKPTTTTPTTTTSTTTTTATPTTTALTTTAVPTCSKSPQAGTCNGIFIRFYYDPANRRCKLFLYSGCGGNDNNFGSLFQCIRTCWT